MSEAEALVCRKCLKKMGDEFLAELELESVVTHSTAGARTRVT